MIDLDRLRTHARTIVEGEGAEEFSPALVEAVARALEPLVDKRPMVDASPSRIRQIRAKWLAQAALSTIRKHQAGE